MIAETVPPSIAGARTTAVCSIGLLIDNEGRMDISALEEDAIKVPERQEITILIP